MKTLRPASSARRAIAGGRVAFLIGFGPVAPMTAYAAATTPLADGPINVSIKAKPNIVFTLDDSTSMQLDFLPDYVLVNTLTNAATNYCRAATGQTECGNRGTADGKMPQHTYANWGMPTAAAPAVGTAPTVAPWPTNYGANSYGPPAVMTSSFNAMFYNPAVTYTAPLKYDGSSYDNMNTTVTTAWTKVPADPFLFPAKYVNLRDQGQRRDLVQHRLRGQDRQRRRHANQRRPLPHQRLAVHGRLERRADDQGRLQLPVREDRHGGDRRRPTSSRTTPRSSGAIRPR